MRRCGQWNHPIKRAKDDRATSPLWHSKVSGVEHIGVHRVTEASQSSANLVRKPTALLDEKFGHVLDQERSGTKFLHEPKEFLKQVISRVIDELALNMTPRPILRKALARRPAHQYVEVANSDAQIVHHCLTREFFDRSRPSLGIWMVELERLQGWSVKVIAAHDVETCHLKAS